MKIITDGKLDFLKERRVEGTAEQQAAVQDIMNRVQASGDEVLKALTRQFDGAQLDEFRVSSQEIEAAFDEVPDDFVVTIQKAAENIKAFHSTQIPQSWQEENADGTILGQRVTPLDAVGVYAPGGTAAYPSSVLMGVIPALVAGVSRVVLVSPPGQDGTLPAGVLVAAHVAGVEEIYKVGGAQAIAALAYGTETIAPVDKIVGPGNIYVALAKRSVYGTVDIDSIAGPSEIVVMADETANPAFVAADLLSQAEHDPLSMAALVTTSASLAEAVSDEVDHQLEHLPRQAIAAESIEQFGRIFLVKDNDEAIRLVNRLAPEHLEIVMADPEAVLNDIKHAGAIFLGPWSSEPVGDYFAGPNHIIPTNHTARFASPLGTDAFVKRSSIIYYSRAALMENGEDIMKFARFEGLEAHARAVEKRIKGESSNES